MEECSLPKARPISCNVCPAFQRRHTSLFCTAESPNRFPALINTTFETALYQMVLHRPSEPAAVTGHLASAASTYPVIRLNQEFRLPEPQASPPSRSSNSLNSLPL